MGDRYKELTEEEYKEKFGIEPENNKLREEAFKKAWEIRNFEINKFWQRSAYFWGFIALIFGGYVKIITEKSSTVVKDMYFDLYLILLGIIFSVGWLLVICGSIRWQENWEAHIDELEDSITGPLYKTIYCKNKQFYSVSKISKILAWVVLSIWILFLLQYFFINCNLGRLLEYFEKPIHFCLFVLIPILGAIAWVIILLRRGRTSEGEYKRHFENEGEFFERRKRSSALRDI